MDEEEDFFRPPAKSPVPAAVIVSAITTVAVFLGLRLLDEAAVLPSFATTAKVRSTTPEGVDVPSLLGMRPEQAREVLKGRDLLLVLSVERDSAQYPMGTIAEQTPLVGSQLPPGSTIQAVLSRGVRQVPVPRVSGLRNEDAIKQIAEAGLSAGPPKNAASDAAPAGTVLETEPAAGTLLAAPSAVTLVVSSGPAPRAIPKVTGMRLRAARDLLAQQGFQVGKIRHNSDDTQGSGVVLDQNPPAAATVPAGTAVELTVNED